MQYSKLQSATASAVEFSVCIIMKNQQRKCRTKIVRSRVEILFDVPLEITYRTIKDLYRNPASRKTAFLTENQPVAI